jgi:hypothetical protein
VGEKVVSVQTHSLGQQYHGRAVYQVAIAEAALIYKYPKTANAPYS